MSRSCLSLALVASLAVVGCGTDSTGPTATLCRVRSGVEVCVDRSEYRPGDQVRLRIRNTSSAAIYRDGCSFKIVGKTSESADFEERFDPSIQCGPGASATDVVANMIQIPPGGIHEEIVTIPTFAFQGFYRVNVWIVDENGTLASPEPAISPTFDVFPSA